MSGGFLGVAHASRVLASASSRSRTFPMDRYLSLRKEFREKIVSARPRNQHARRMRYPINNHQHAIRSRMTRSMCE